MVASSRREEKMSKATERRWINTIGSLFSINDESHNHGSWGCGWAVWAQQFYTIAAVLFTDRRQWEPSLEVTSWKSAVLPLPPPTTPPVLALPHRWPIPSCDKQVPVRCLHFDLTDPIYDRKQGVHMWLIFAAVQVCKHLNGHQTFNGFTSLPSYSQFNAVSFWRVRFP